MKRLGWAVIGGGILLWMLGGVEARYVFAPLLGLAIWMVGLASFRSLGAGGAQILDSPPEPVDTRTERITYWCADCGAELLLLVRGAQTPPRHCGERMIERREVAHLN
jgi:DNA-directed RNA polymerase subunit RPC12/RpoP